MMETKAKPHHHTILLSDLEEAEVDKGLLASLTTWMLQMDKDKTGKVSKTGSRVLVTKTKMTYQNIFSQLEHFFFKMIGDYDSLLILQDHPPENCISMKVESLLQFVDYKFQSWRPLLSLHTCVCHLLIPNSSILVTLLTKP
jgi:hypothetical protein